MKARCAMQLNVNQVANGKWHGILKHFGLNDMQLSGKHTSCPNCGGKDRFHFDNIEGRGTYYCSQCGAGDGVSLVMKIKGLEFKEAAREIEKAAGFSREEKQKIAKTDEQVLSALKKVWNETKPITESEAAWWYLTGRDLIVPKSLRAHKKLFYRDDEKSGYYEAMIAKVQAPDGRGVSIHRTYLEGIQKAGVKTPKKLMTGLPLQGAAIRLFDHAEVLGVAEGIETAIAAQMINKVPVWSCINANGLASFEVPSNVKKLCIFADNDANFTGQQAAYTLAKRYSNLEVELYIPLTVGQDWADVLNGMDKR